MILNWITNWGRNMARRKAKEADYISKLTEKQRIVITDMEHKSKAFVPLQIDPGNEVEVVEIDGGLITGLSEGEYICDNLVYTIKKNTAGLNITWFLELKGTKNEKEAKHAVDQIIKSIYYMQDQAAYPQATKYITNRDFVFAAIAGAPDKTLPVLNNEDIKILCKKLKAISGRRKDVKDMFMLFCYIKPNVKYKTAKIKGNRAPYDILCYSKQEGYIPYPSMLMRLLEGKNIQSKCSR